MNGKMTSNDNYKGRGAGSRILLSLFSNIPFIVTQIVAVCCLVADVFILKRRVYAVTFIPIEALALLYLTGRNRTRGGGG